MMEAYERLDFTNDFEGAGDIFVDYHGAVQSAQGREQRCWQSCEELTDFKELADVVGDGILKEAIDVNSTQISRFQQLKEEFLGINNNLDFMKHYDFLLKELDPTKNGYVTN